MVNFRQILNRFMYNDRATVSRSVKTKIGKSDDFTSEYRCVYEDVPCHLAQYGKELSAHRDDTTQKITEDLRLTYDPEYEILENDVVDVEHHGQQFRLFAGTAFKYPTHVELSLRRRKEARQR